MLFKKHLYGGAKAGPITWERSDAWKDERPQSAHAARSSLYNGLTFNRPNKRKLDLLNGYGVQMLFSV